MPASHLILRTVRLCDIFTHHRVQGIFKPSNTCTFNFSYIVPFNKSQLPLSMPKILLDKKWITARNKNPSSLSESKMYSPNNILFSVQETRETHCSNDTSHLISWDLPISKKKCIISLNTHKQCRKVIINQFFHKRDLNMNFKFATNCLNN